LCFFFLCACHTLDLHSFPTRRSSDLWLRRNRRNTRCPGGHQRSRKQHHGFVYSLLGRCKRDSRVLRTIRRRSLSDPEYDRVECRSEEHTSELQSPYDLVCRLLLEKKK